ncbi:MAG TPA: peptidyl-dipeptidase Dcp [Myxococcota bacterium]|nr:peptidyl-dipeptidase Dcp [Myxococcota bacterium]
MFRARLYLVSCVVAAAASSACHGASTTRTREATSQAMTRSNPLLTPSPLPYQVPPFDQIRDSDFQEAFEAGIREQLAEVRAIADDPSPPTFENTLEALERSGGLLSRVNMAFSALAGANTNDVLQKLSEDIAPQLAAIQDAIFLNAKLFARIDALHAGRDRLSLDAEAKHLLEVQHRAFELAGARLAEAEKERLKALNAEEAALGAKFTNQLLAAAKARGLAVDSAAALAGLSEADIHAAAQNANERGMTGRWLIDLQNTTQQASLRSLSDRATRQKLFEAGWTRAERGDENDTRATLLRIAAIRAEKAHFVGYPSYAAWKVADQMAKTPEHVEALFGKLVPAATARARAEAATLQTRIDAQHGGFQLQPWDWDYYAEQVRREKYDLDEGAIRPYFELSRVLQDGVFYAAQQLYGLTFRERHDLPVYHPDVRVFEVFEEDGSHLGIFYGDFFARSNKSGGAWMSNLVNQSHLLGTQPVIYNVLNIPKPAAGQPALLSFDEVTTLFHEFGHALHGFFANQRYPSLSGTSVARDFVEFPSQFNEHWATEPSIFAHYAVHHETGEAMPQHLVDKLKRAAKFNQGYALTEILAASHLDMAWHRHAPGATPTDVDAFEAKALKEAGLDLPQVPPRYRSSYFLHIWGNSYAAGYYAYTWTRVLGDDCFGWFTENGGLSRKNGQLFREAILSRGNTVDYEALYAAFRGRGPKIDAMLENYGLAP